MTIPQHIIDKAAKGIDEFLADLQRGDWDNYPDHLARAALEAVAADIWDAGHFNGRMDQEYREATPNPYRASETA